MGKDTSFQIPGYKFHLSFLPSPNTLAVNRTLLGWGWNSQGETVWLSGPHCPMKG